MKKLKLLFVALLVMLSVTASVGCQKIANKEAEKNGISTKKGAIKGLPEKLDQPDFTFLYTQDPPNPTVLQTTQTYVEKYGGKVQYVTALWNEKNTKLATMINAGDAPDLFVFNHADIPLVMARDLLQPLEDYINFKDPIWDKDLLSQLAYKGKIYGANDELNVFVIFYNEDMFYNNGLKTPKEYYKEGKWNWETFRELAIKLTQDTDANGTIDQYGLLSNNRVISCLLGTNDTEFVKSKEDGTIELTLNDPKLLEAIRFLQDSYITVPFQNTSGGAIKMFLEGKGAMIVERKVFIRDDLKPGEYKFNWDIVPFPVGPSGQSDITEAAVALWGIPVGAKNPQDAAAWMYLWRMRDNAEGDPTVMQSLKPEHIELFKKLESGKKHVAKYPGAGLEKIINSKFHNDIKKGIPVVTLLEQYAPQFQDEINILLENK